MFSRNNVTNSLDFRQEMIIRKSLPGVTPFRCLLRLGQKHFSFPRRCYLISPMKCSVAVIPEFAIVTDSSIIGPHQ